MKKLLSIIICSFILIGAKGQPPTAKISQLDPTKKIQVVEASCGECQFHMKGKGCELAIRMDGKTYFVDGTSIDDHGDAHGAEGFCEAVRKAEVQGEIVDNRFKATYFKIKPIVIGNKQ